MAEGKLSFTEFSNRTKWVGAGIIVGAMFLLYVFFVLDFGVNVPFWDEWEFLSRFREVYAWRMNWWDLALSKHNEHLIGFAFLVSGLQLLLSSFDSKLQLLSGVLVQAVAYGVMAAVLWRSVPQDRRPAWLALSSMIWFSLSQHKNLLWAFQTAWFLVTLLLVITLACLHRAKNLESRVDARQWVALAAVSAFLASFTSAQGLIIWFAGSVYLFVSENYQFGAFFRSHITRFWIVVMTLAACALLMVLQFKGISGAGGGGEFSMLTFAYIFVGIHGAFFGDVGVLGVAIFGGLMLVFIGLALIKALASQDRAAYALPVALIAFGLVFVFLVALGRAKFGTGAARDPHYTAYSLMSIFGALTIFVRRDHVVVSRGMIRFGAALFPLVIVVATFAATYDAVLKGIDWRRSKGLAAATLMKYREAPDFVLDRLLFGNVALVRSNAAFLESNGLSVFGDAHAIPSAVKAYLEMPWTLIALEKRYPDRNAAIVRAWWVYQIASDLQRAFDPMAADFADRLISWSYDASRNGGHYLSPYLRDFSGDFAAIQKSEEARKSK